MRKRRLPPTPIMDLPSEDDTYRTRKFTSIQVSSTVRNSHDEQVNQNKKFLTQILKYSNMAIKLPDSITSRSLQQSLKAFNVKLASIAASKQILADYENHFRGLDVFFRRMVAEGEKLPQDEEIIWRMFFLNNMAIIAFNNGDYTTSLDLLKQILEEHKKGRIMQPVFTLAITNLSAIYHKMDSKIKCFEYLENAFEYSKKLLDGAGQSRNPYDSHDNKLNTILAIQCIMVIKHSQRVETPTHNIKQIEKLMVKLVKDSNKISATNMDIPYINKYLEEKKLTELKDIHSSIAGSLASSRRSRISKSRRKSYHLESLNFGDINQATGFSQEVLSQNTELDSPVKRYSYNKIKKEIDQLNSKVTKLEFQNSKIQTTLVEILESLKNPDAKFTNKLEPKNLMIGNIEKALDLSFVASRVMFKTLQVFISFYDQGIKLKTFTGEQQKLSWGQLENIFKLLDLFHIYFPYLELNPTRHTVAWIISKYLTIENGIKIKKEPWPILRFEHDKKMYGLYHIRQREFTIYGSDVKAIVFEMSQKSFNYYFNSLKIDEYEAWSMSYFDQEPCKLQEDYFMEVIQLKADTTFEQDIQEVFGNFKTVIKQTINNPVTYKRVKLWFDQSTRDDITFFGALYNIYNNIQKSQLQYNLYSLNAYEGVKLTDPIPKIFTYTELESKYSMNLADISRASLLLYIYINLADMVSIGIQAKKRDGKVMYVARAKNQDSQYVYFQQRMVLKKYYRPIFIYIMRTKNRYVSIRFSYYNEAQINTLNISVVLNMYIPKKLEQNSDQYAKKFVKIKGKVKTDFLMRLFGQIESGGAEAKSFIHVEELISMIEAETKNWGQ